MIIIVVIDKLLAFTGPFPIKLSEKLFSSGALRLLSADVGAGSCSWHWVLMIPEKRFFSASLFLNRLLTLLLMSRAWKSHSHLLPPSWRWSRWKARALGVRSGFGWGVAAYQPPSPSSILASQGSPKCPNPAGACFSLGWGPMRHLSSVWALGLLLGCKRSPPASSYPTLGRVHPGHCPRIGQVGCPQDVAARQCEHQRGHFPWILGLLLVGRP